MTPAPGLGERSSFGNAEQASEAQAVTAPSAHAVRDGVDAGTPGGAIRSARAQRTESGSRDLRRAALAAGRKFGVPVFDLDAMELDLDVVRLVDEELLAKHRVLPLRQRGNRLYVGIADPTDFRALDDIRFQTSLRVEPVVVEQDKLEARVARAIEAVDTTLSSFDDAEFDDADVDVSATDEEPGPEVAGADVEDAPIVRFVNRIMHDAIRRSASDIHFEPYEKYCRIRLRMDGVLEEIARPPAALAMKVAARLKVMARLDIAERRVPQDGRIRMRLSDSRSVDFRVNTCPTLFGEKIVCRLLDSSSARLGIDSLGYDAAQKRAYLDNLMKPYGMILVTGPTGSGKTVSLYSGLNILNTADRNISTAEDPAEINVPGINQVNVNPKVGLTFASALRAFLRQDPDVIMVGEIRDLETAEIAIKAAQTGHLVLSTLHTNDAPRTLTRLVDMGVKPYAIASSVSLIIAQRLARRLCRHCKEAVEPPDDALLAEGFDPADVEAMTGVFQATGCNRCNGGYSGRIGIYQVMPVTEAIGRIILQGGDAMQIAEQAREDGVSDLRMSGLRTVREGITSLEEINRVTVD